MIQVCICDLVSVWGRASDGKSPTKTLEEWSNLLAANSHSHVHPIGYIRGFKKSNLSTCPLCLGLIVTHCFKYST